MSSKCTFSTVQVHYSKYIRNNMLFRSFIWTFVYFIDLYKRANFVRQPLSSKYNFWAFNSKSAFDKCLIFHSFDELILERVWFRFILNWFSLNYIRNNNQSFTSSYTSNYTNDRHLVWICKIVILNQHEPTSKPTLNQMHIYLVSLIVDISFLLSSIGLRDLELLLGWLTNTGIWFDSYRLIDKH